MFETDVIVVGSGASGLAAALTAAHAGLEVAIVEKTPLIGGTSAVSGGSIWAPANRWMGASGIKDSRDAAHQYLIANAMADTEEKVALIEAFLDQVHPMLELVSARTGIEFEVNEQHPDYQPHLAGSQTGRTLQGGLFDTKRLPEELRNVVRKSSSGVPITRLEVDAWGMDTLDRWDWALLAERMSNGIVGMGSALVGELLAGSVALGATVHLSAQAVELTKGPDGRVDGLVVDGENGRQTLHARRGVILASGGFEWSSELVSAFLGKPMVAPASPPANTGDGLRMSMALGASLGNMSEAWWGPMIQPTGDFYDNQPLFRPTSGLRALPGGIIVNQRGRRFVNEAMNYNDLGKALGDFDPMAYLHANQPAWLVFDERFRTSYSVATCTPESPTPTWMTTASSLAELAAAVGIDPAGLSAQVDEFNVAAARGEDPAFGRGESVYDTYRGDGRVEPHRNLRPLEDGPYYAVPLLLGCLGTKGGPQTDAKARVLDAWGQPIPGLFAAGNVAASPFGPGYPGAGATLGVGMTFGYIAASTIAEG